MLKKSGSVPIDHKATRGFTLIDHRAARRGFTLIELSIVLVIVGLLAASILVGSELIAAAAVRAQVAQIEKYNTAVNTFKGKYGFLPGDIPEPAASQYGFVARGSNPGQGDGNGIIEGFNGIKNCGQCNIIGETTTFWVDLTAAKMLDGGLSTASETIDPFPGGPLTGTQIDLFYPKARLGGNLYVWSGGGNVISNGIHYYGLSQPTQIFVSGFNSTPGLTVQQAYAIDSKIDDGQPQSGRVMAWYLGCCGAGNIAWPGGDTGASDTAKATPPSATSCYDDGGVTGTQRRYSLSQNGGRGMNCALSFQFQ